MKRHRGLFFIAVVFVSALLALLLGSGRDAAARPSPPPPAEGEALGKELFTARCAECHGTRGDGDGPAAAFLAPRPRDLTSGKFKFRSTESGSVPTDLDLLNTIRNGLHGASMPEFGHLLHGDSLQALLTYVKSLSPRFAAETPRAVPPVTISAPTPASIAAGEKIYRKLECASCHGSNGAGKDAVASDLQDEWGYATKATDLTQPWTFRGGSSTGDIYLRFRTGLDGSPMPSYAGTATEQEMKDLAGYVASLGRKPAWEMGAEEVKALYAAEDAAARQQPVARGRYLVDAIGCAMCHSPLRDDGGIIEPLRFAGGQRWDLYPFDNLISYNLTSDKETGLGGWTDDQIKTLITTGVRRDGTRMLPYPMPWPAFAGMRDDDLRAIIAYLRTIPPVRNEIPKPESPNIFSYLWGKFQMLILKKDIPVRVYVGNAGTAPPGSAAQSEGKEGQR